MPLLSELSGLGKEFSEDLVRFSEGAPGRLLEFDKKPEPYMRLARFAKSLPTRPAREALAATEEFKAICESLNIKNVRVANTEGLALLATYVARDPAADPRWTQRIAETHRRIRGNANPTIAFDALFTGILTI